MWYWWADHFRYWLFIICYGMKFQFNEEIDTLERWSRSGRFIVLFHHQQFKIDFIIPIYVVKDLWESTCMAPSFSFFRRVQEHRDTPKVHLKYKSSSLRRRSLCLISLVCHWDFAVWNFDIIYGKKGSGWWVSRSQACGLSRDGGEL